MDSKAETPVDIGVLQHISWCTGLQNISGNKYFLVLTLRCFLSCSILHFFFTWIERFNLQPLNLISFLNLTHTLVYKKTNRGSLKKYLVELCRNISNSQYKFKKSRIWHKKVSLLAQNSIFFYRNVDPFCSFLLAVNTNIKLYFFTHLIKLGRIKKNTIWEG